jgi:hypothetical protein
MATPQRRSLPPLRVREPRDPFSATDPVSPVSNRVPQRSLAPDWISPTEGNGAGLPRTDLHIALVTTSEDEYDYYSSKLRVAKPPLWPGKVHLHIIMGKDTQSDDLMIQQALVDLGWADSRDLEIGPPASVTEGYPSGTDK